MAEQLKSIRTNFVDKVSRAVISQLLDNLLEDSVLNDGEKDSILEENQGRADQARNLIDTVRMKGDDASNKMITHLQRRDPTLYSNLLSSVETAPPANKKDTYPVTSASFKSRVALLITNITFANVMLNRRGADKDEENMEKLLNRLGYEVVKHTNLTGKQIDDAVFQFSKHPKLIETDSVWVVIMSHGKLGHILGVKWKGDDENPDHFCVNNIYKYFDSEHCRALLDKPKVIVIQACRGEEDGAALISDSAGAAASCPAASAAAGGFEDDAVRFVHREKDFITFLSCTPGTVSYRQRDRGSFLIQFIVEIFVPSNRQHDIDELFRRVMQRFEEFSPGSRRQMASKDRCTLTKRFYVFPPSGGT